MQIPVVPAFITGDTSMQKMAQLSGCVTWVSCAGSYPVWHLYKTATQAFTGSYTLITFPKVAFDSDRVAASGGGLATIQTQGYYTTEACIPAVSQSTSFTFRAVFIWTAGPYNPHYTSGTTVDYGYRSAVAQGATGTDAVVCLDDLCPVVCYPGDTISVQLAGTASSATVDVNNPTSTVAGRFVPNFTGRWVRIGS